MSSDTDQQSRKRDRNADTVLCIRETGGTSGSTSANSALGDSFSTGGKSNESTQSAPALQVDLDKGAFGKFGPSRCLRNEQGKQIVDAYSVIARSNPELIKEAILSMSPDEQEHRCQEIYRHGIERGQTPEEAKESVDRLRSVLAGGPDLMAQLLAEHSEKMETPAAEMVKEAAGVREVKRGARLSLRTTT